MYARKQLQWEKQIKFHQFWREVLRGKLEYSIGITTDKYHTGLAQFQHKIYQPHCLYFTTNA